VFIRLRKASVKWFSIENVRQKKVKDAEHYQQVKIDRSLLLAGRTGFVISASGIL